VLPIGGVKEKVIAAVQAGITRVVLPSRNRKDLDDVPESARKLVEFIWAERVEDALSATLSETTAAPDLAATGDGAADAPARKRAARSA
jgi:ATP-dependent Lon protease